MKFPITLKTKLKTLKPGLGFEYKQNYNHGQILGLCFETWVNMILDAQKNKKILEKLIYQHTIKNRRINKIIFQFFINLKKIVCRVRNKIIFYLIRYY